MDVIFSLPIETALTYLLAGAIIPALCTLLIPLMNLPAIRIPISGAVTAFAVALMVPLQAVRGASFALGKIVSTILTKRLGEFGEQLETKAQEFIESTILGPLFKTMGPEVEGFASWLLFGPFWKGLDQDDKMVSLEAAANKAVLNAAASIPSMSISADPMQERENFARKEAAVAEVLRILGPTAKKLTEKTIDMAVEHAVDKFKDVRKLF